MVDIIEIQKDITMLRIKTMAYEDQLKEAADVIAQIESTQGNLPDLDQLKERINFTLNHFKNK